MLVLLLLLLLLLVVVVVVGAEAAAVMVPAAQGYVMGVCYVLCIYIYAHMLPPGYHIHIYMRIILYVYIMCI